MKEKRVCFFICIFFHFIFIFSAITYKGYEVILKKSVESKNAFISYVSINKLPYIIKQKRIRSKVIVSVLREALAAYIAQDLNIAHSVEIISMKDNFPGKLHKNLSATLHTIAPGKMVRDIQGKYSQLCIKQRCPKITNRWFDEIIVDHITWHKDLPVIVALDIFLCNTDRHKGNLFYDEIRDSFCAIDMDNIYRRNLSLYACDNLEKMIKDKKKFTAKEIEALKVVKNTMEFLLQKYSSGDLVTLLYIFAHQAGYIDNGSVDNNRIKKRIDLYEQIIIESHVTAYKFVKMLDKVINHVYM